MTEIRFNRAFEFRYGVMERLTPLVRRVVARNPGPFTFHGTSTFIIGNREVAVIDPGPALPQHVEAILAGLAGETVSHIIATHTHADHSPACRLLGQRTGAPTCGFGPHDPRPANLGGVDRDFVPDHRLDHGDVVSGLDWHLRAIHTPGHCANHLCLALPEENTLFCGDQLMAWSTTIILPPDGSVRDYLASLDTLKRRPETIYRPTHGAAIENPRPYIDQITAHRRRRVEEVYEAVAAGLGDVPAMRARASITTSTRPCAAAPNFPFSAPCTSSWSRAGSRQRTNRASPACSVPPPDRRAATVVAEDEHLAAAPNFPFSAPCIFS